MFCTENVHEKTVRRNHLVFNNVKYLYVDYNNKVGNMISKQNVIDGFRFILGRDPESSVTIENNLKQNNIQTLRRNLILSNEFSNKYSSMRNENAYSFITAEDVEKTKIIFMHVPKTGGTTLHSLLADKFKHAEICPERFNKLGNYKAGELAKYRYYSGHYDFNSCQVIPGLNNEIITFIRKPQDRLISLYYFFRSHTVEYSEANGLRLPILANTHNFCDFLNCKEIYLTNNIFNPYIQLLTGRTPTGEFSFEDENITLNDADFELLELAKKRLASIAAFGVLERFDESVKLISNVLGLKLPKEIKKKMVLEDMVDKGSLHMKLVEKEVLTDEHYKEILFNSYLDSELYLYALELFEERISLG